MGISVGKVTAKNANYYIDAVAKGKEDYYSGLGEAPPTRFSGRTDGIFERPEVVPVETVGEIFKLQEEGDQRKSVVAFDLTCSVPKSASVLWATGDEETRKAIEDSLREAAEAAIGSMHWYAREGHAGARIIEVDPPPNMFDFRHRTSRALDPQLHSHIIVGNRVWVEGRWLALDAREVYAQAKNIGTVFDSTFRRLLTEKLGIAWEQTKESGASGDIRGVDKKLIAFWSSRRQEVEARLDEWKGNFESEMGREPTRREVRIAAQGFTLSTRIRKETGAVYSDESLLGRWQTEARVFCSDSLVSAKSAAREWAGNARGTRESLQNRLVGGRATVADPVEALLIAVDKSHQPTQNRWQLETLARGIAPQNEKETTAEWNARIEGLCSQAVNTGELISLSRPAIDAAASVRADGLPSSMSPKQERFATRVQIEKELAVLKTLSTSRSNQGLGDVVESFVTPLIGDGQGKLNEGQAAAIIKVAKAETIGAVIVGAPGVGKTTALTPLVQAAKSDGWTVTGLATTGKAAGELSDAVEKGSARKFLKAVEQGGGTSSTISAWLGNQRREAGVDTNEELLAAWGNTPSGGLSKELILVDESSLVGTNDLVCITSYAQHVGAKIIKIGDHKQIESIDQAGLFSAIATGEESGFFKELGIAPIPVAKIETVVRQEEEWERKAAEQLRRGGDAAKKAIDVYAENGRIHPVESKQEAVREIASRMADDIAAGKESIAIAYTRADVQSINHAVLNEQIKRGVLSKETLPDFKFRPGERIITKQNEYDAKGEMIIKNGELWTVMRQRGQGQTAELRVANLKTGKKQWFTKEYVEKIKSDDGGRQVRSGYASVPHTIQSASLNGSSYTLGSEHATPSTILVPLTRGKESNHYWVPLDLDLRRDDALISTNKNVNPQEDAVAWLKAKAKAAPSENEKSAVQSIASAKAMARGIQESDRAKAAADEVAEAKRNSELARQGRGI